MSHIKGVPVSLWRRITVAVLNLIWPFGYFTLEVECRECGRIVEDPAAHDRAFHGGGK